MGRLIDWPRDLRVTGWQPLSGPRSVGASSTESTTGYVQTVSSAFGAWQWQLSIETMKGRMFRIYRGMVIALGGGANAVRVTFRDPDGLTWSDAGVTITDAQKRNGVPFSNGKAFANGKNWKCARPSVAVAADAALGDTIVFLADQYWGHDFAGGEWIGFFPFHLGKYDITEVIAPGQYRIWPPLRKAITAADSYATLAPTMAMRLLSEQGASAKRGNLVADGNVMTVIEVQDDDARNFFAD